MPAPDTPYRHAGDRLSLTGEDLAAGPRLLLRAVVAVIVAVMVGGLIYCT